MRALVLSLMLFAASPVVANDVVYLDAYVETGLPEDSFLWEESRIAAYTAARDFIASAAEEGGGDENTPDYFVYVGVQIPICKLSSDTLTYSSESDVTISRLPLPGAEECCWMMVEVCSPESFINVRSTLVTPYGTQHTTQHNPIENIGGGCNKVAIIGRCNATLSVDFYGTHPVNTVRAIVKCTAESCDDGLGD